jgi:hypothetical protein
MSKELLCHENGEEGLRFLPSRLACLPRVSIPIPGEVLFGVLKFGKTIYCTILRFADNRLKHAMQGKEFF